MLLLILIIILIITTYVIYSYIYLLHWELLYTLRMNFSLSLSVSNLLLMLPPSRPGPADHGRRPRQRPERQDLCFLAAPPSPAWSWALTLCLILSSSWVSLRSSSSKSTAGSPLLLCYHVERLLPLTPPLGQSGRGSSDP